MKHTYLFIAAVLMFLSCTQAEENGNGLEPKEQVVNLTVSMDFNYTQIPLFEEQDATRAATSATDAGVNRISFSIFDKDDNAVYEATQLSSDTDFGTFKKYLAPGTYTLVAVATTVSGTEIGCPSITSPTLATLSERPKSAVYSATQKEVTIDNTSSKSVTMEMRYQKTAIFQLVTQDVVPTEVAKVNMEFRTGNTGQSTFTIDPSTGLDPNAGNFTISSDVTVGNSVNLAAYVLLSSTEETINIKITALDKDNNILYSREKEDVSFQQAYLTKATGTLFSNIGATLSFEKGYIDIKNIDL